LEGAPNKNLIGQCTWIWDSKRTSMDTVEVYFIGNWGKEERKVPLLYIIIE